MGRSRQDCITEFVLMTARRSVPLESLSPRRTEEPRLTRAPSVPSSSRLTSWFAYRVSPRSATEPAAKRIRGERNRLRVNEDSRSVVVFPPSCDYPNTRAPDSKDPCADDIPPAVPSTPTKGEKGEIGNHLNTRDTPVLYSLPGVRFELPRATPFESSVNPFRHLGLTVETAGAWWLPVTTSLQK